MENGDTEAGPDTIPRIAEEISFIRDCPVGDIPNVQVDGWCTDATDGIPIENEMTLSFHSMSLPSARLVWHCPYISVFSSTDGKVRGENYREYTLLRFDGETWESDEHSESDIRIGRSKDFAGWDNWKERNREGIDCSVTVRRERNRIFMETENLGISLRSVTTIHDGVKNLYVALTGDQCAISDIHVTRP